MAGLRSLSLAPASGPRSQWQTQLAVNCVRVARRTLRDPKMQPFADVATRKYISDERRFVVAAVPKCASRSLRSTFYVDKTIASDTVELSIGFDELYAQRPELLSYYTFAFVRNPWMRVLSCWNDKIVLSNTVAKVLILSRFPDLKPKMSFEAFVEWLASPAGADERADRHWLSQSRIIGDNCDFVGKLERYSDDLAKVADALRIDRIRNVKRNAKGEFEDYRSHYNQRTAALVAQRYAEDIERFGYTF